MTSPSTARRATYLLAPAAVISIVGLMIVPLPPLLLDLLLSIDIALAVVLLLTAIYVKEPIEFSVFPSLLLLLTLLRLALNVAGTRLILLHGAEGIDAAGHVIMSFGQFVVGGNFIVGVVVFLVLIAIQFVVINHGAVRISEVTARFTLDAMPGKQMAIDADLNAGLIDEREARTRRETHPPGGGLLRRDGRRHPLHPARRAGRVAHHRRQHRGRARHRRHAARHGSAARRPDLHHSDHRRRAGHGDSGAAGVDGRRLDHDSCSIRIRSGRGSRDAAPRRYPSDGCRRRRARLPRAYTGSAQDRLPLGGPRDGRRGVCEPQTAGGPRQTSDAPVPPPDALDK